MTKNKMKASELYPGILDKENYSEEFLYNAICYFKLDPEKVVDMLNELPAEVGTELAASFHDCREKTKEILQATLAERDFSETFHSPEIEDILFYQMSHGLPVS